MSAVGRISLRKQLLHDVYEYYFANGGRAMPVGKDLFDNTECRLALLYLSDKKFIEVDYPDGPGAGIFTAARIRSAGIDEVEYNRMDSC